MNITIFDKYNYKQFFNDNKDIKTYVYMIKRWIKSKERTLPCYKEFGFDTEGCIYIKYRLPYQNYWIPLNLISLEVLNERI